MYSVLLSHRSELLASAVWRIRYNLSIMDMVIEVISSFYIFCLRFFRTSSFIVCIGGSMLSQIREAVASRN